MPIDTDDLASRLAGFEVLVLMRERTRFPRRVLSRLPNLRLLITTGMRNASVDADYLRERGARAFGMTSIAWSEHLTDERAAEVGATRVTQQELLARADVLSIHLLPSIRSRCPPAIR